MRRRISVWITVWKSLLRDLHGVGRVLWLTAVVTCLMALTQLEAGRAVAQTQAPATKSEIRRTLPLSSFYDTPSPLPSGKPGELIRAEPFEEYALPAGVSAVRILYHSRSATGEDVAASGVVLFPEEETPPA